MFGLGPQELLLILILVLIFFGAQKIPDLARSLGKGLSEFRKAQRGDRDEAAQKSSAIDLCPSCASKLEPDAHFCPQCGHEVQAERGRICGKCKSALRPADRFCPHCGQTLQ